MKLRWFIRAFAIALLTLCVSGWGGSYFYGGFISYTSRGHSYITYSINTHMGGVRFYYNDHGRPGWPSPGWEVEHGRSALSFDDCSWDWRFLGIGYHYFDFAPYSRGISHCIGIPFWFPSLLSAGLLWFVWRKTRMKDVGRGFPVEVTQPPPSSTNFIN